MANEDDASAAAGSVREERELAGLVARGRIIGPALVVIGLLNGWAWLRGGYVPFLVLAAVAVLGGLVLTVHGLSAHRDLRSDRASRRRGRAQ